MTPEEIDDLAGRVAAARRAVVLAPEDGEAHATLGDVLLTLDGDGPGAEAAYLVAATRRPEDGDVRLRLGLARLRIGRLDDARDDFVEGLRLGASTSWVRTVGTAIRRLGVPDRFAEPYASIRVALDEPGTVDRTDPQIVEHQLDTAILWWQTGARAAALEMLESLVDANPSCVDGLAALAEFRFESGRLDDAEALARRTLAVDPDAATALFVLGLVCEERHDGAGAARWFERVRALPTDPEDRDWMMGSLIDHHMAGRHPEMIHWYEETAPADAGDDVAPAPEPVPPTLPAGAPVRRVIDGEPTGALASIRAKLETLRRLEAEHGFGVVIEEPQTLEPVPELPYGLVELFSLFRRLEGGHLHVEQPVEINSRTAWLTHRRDLRSNPLRIGQLRLPTSSGLPDMTWRPILFDVQDGHVFSFDPDEYMFLQANPCADVESDHLGADVVAFVDDYLLGAGYPLLVETLLGPVAGTRRIRKGRDKGELADTWLRLLLRAGLVD